MLSSIGPSYRFGAARAFRLSNSEKERRSPQSDPFVPGNTGFFQDNFQKIYTYLAAMRIRDSKIDFTFNHMLVLVPGDGAPPPKCSKAFDQIGSTDRSKSHWFFA